MATSVLISRYSLLWDTSRVSGGSCLPDWHTASRRAPAVSAVGPIGRASPATDRRDLGRGTAMATSTLSIADVDAGPAEHASWMPLVVIAMAQILMVFN